MDYQDLPDYMDAETLKTLFIHILSNDLYYQDQNRVLNNIYELAERYWHTYELIDNELKDKISDFIIKRIDQNSVENIDIILSIIPLLGLRKVLNEIIDNKDKIQKEEIFVLLYEVYNECGDTVDEPYSGMKKFNKKNSNN